MRLVIDANALFSALIKDSTSAELLVSDELELYAPTFIFDELSKYRDVLLRKSQKSPEKFERVLEVFKGRIKMVEEIELSAFMDHAKRISPDTKDVFYFSAALFLNAAIWSNDKALKNQEVIEVYNTEELLKEISRP